MRVRCARGTALLLVLALTGCARGGAPDLVRLTSDGPDEFSILPPEPLEQPPSYAVLPPPVPGGPSRTDPDPLGDAVAALGGRPGAAARVPARDAAVVAYASRGGVEPGVRSVVAAEDLQDRQRRSPRLLERIFGTNTYERAYRPQALNQQAELERFRQAGIRTPAAPPVEPD
jgi:hypothetical protein